ncbi:MAG: SH3 domain-containing protein [Clostridium sp.]|nr:SH3 domain-containing protein [Clostridium sp.]MCM1398785.1 SH3 domain-containing protein [Clostridium sp.]MCM1458583.1 SH3 domain-containing protein [Bacteroides sp.]
MEKFGIDVSEFQGAVDWQKAKTSGVTFAILRCGFGENVESQDDKRFAANAEACEALNIPYGVYLYSYSTNVEHAKSEAEHVIRLVKGKKLTYPVFYDMEDNDTLGSCTTSVMGDIAEAFCNEILKAGYQVGIYANLYWLNNKLTDSRFDKWDKWVAQYYKECQYEKPYVGWQYSSTGRVDGVTGNCDMNFFYKEYAGGENPKKTINELADEVIAGKWGINKDRKDRLTAAGYDYDAVQARVNQLLSKKKTIEELADEVIAGKWGIDKDRKDRLTAAGYDYDAVQARVNERLGANSFQRYNVKITTAVLNVRSGAGTNYSVTGSVRMNEVYTIVAEASGTGASKWGKLISGAGWISLDYARKI